MQAHDRDAGVNVVSLNVGFGEMDVTDHVQTLASIRRWVSMQPDYMLITMAADVEIAHQTGRLGVCFDIEGAADARETWFALLRDIVLLAPVTWMWFKAQRRYLWRL